MQPHSTPKRLAPVPDAQPTPDAQSTGSGIDLDRITTGASPALDYLSRAAGLLAIPDPVQEYFGPVVGRWRDLHDQAELWRRAAHSVEELGERLTTPLGGLDSVWDGQVSDTFLEHMRQIEAAGKSASDAMAAMADVLDRTADGVQQLVAELVELLAGGANRISSAMIMPVAGEERAARQLTEIRGYSRRVFEAVRELLEAFAEMCESMDAGQPFAEVRMAATFPQQTWSFQPDDRPDAVPTPHIPPQAVPDQPVAAATDLVGAGAGGSGGGSVGVPGGGGPGGGGPGGGPLPQPAEPALRTLAAEPSGQSTPAAASAGATAAGSGTETRGGAGAGFMPMGMGAGMGGQDNERKAQSRITADPTEIFGKPTKTAPPVIGDD